MPNNSKLTEKQVKDILLRIENGESVRSLSRIYKVTRRTIQYIKHNESWKHIPRNQTTIKETEDV